jgi:Ran-binding protein 3
MRAEGVLRLVLNVSLYVGMTCLEDGKHVRMTVFEDNERRLITLRVGLSVFLFLLYLSTPSGSSATALVSLGNGRSSREENLGVSGRELTLRSSDWIAESRVRTVRPYPRAHSSGIGTA